MTVTAKLVGVEALARKLEQQARKIGEKAARGLKNGGDKLFEVAQYLVPTETGLLASTGYVSSKGQGFQTVVTIGYTGAAEYTIRVHEDLTLRHGSTYNEYYADDIAKGLRTPRREQEQAKWLEDATALSIGTVLNEVKKEMKK